MEFTRFPEGFAERYRRQGYWQGETLGGLLRPWARADGERIALVEPGRGRFSYAELDQKADRFASGLWRLGIRRHDRVVVQLGNVIELPVLSIALFRLGAAPVFALPAHRRRDISYLCDSSGAVAYVTHAVFAGFDHREIAREIAASSRSVKHLLIAGEPGEFRALDELEASVADLGPETRSAPAPGDVAFFLLSGGTTGWPKLIPRTHDDYAYQLRATAEALGFGRDGVYLAVLPVAHNAALGCPGVLGALRAGGTAVLVSNASPDQIFPMIQAEGVTLTTLMPPLLRIWADSAEYYDVDLTDLILQVGSARLAPDLAQAVRTQLGARLTQWFGMSEGLLTYTRLGDPPEVVDHTQGRPLCPADEIRVVDENGNDVKTGEIGELWTRGPYTLRGYYDAPEHNARAFTEDGFLKTGDLVRLTPEGNMVVEGRTKDVINRGGEKIAAGEVEDLILKHPGVRDAAVVAVPDELLGERIAAFLVPAESPPKLPDLKGFLRSEGLAEYKMPELLQNLTALPLTKVGKVDKAALRDLAKARPPAEPCLRGLH